MANSLRIISGAIIGIMSFVSVVLTAAFGFVFGYSFASPLLGIVLGIFFAAVGVAGILLMIDGFRTD